MQGVGYTPVQHIPQGYTFVDALPVSGDCALGGCGDVYSEYTDECGRAQCGCNVPGCGAALPAAPVIPRVSHSSTDCTVPGAECENWLAFHNCAPYLPEDAMAAHCAERRG